jgi:hypothetical protein
MQLGQSNATPQATPSRRASFIVKGPNLTISSEGTPGLAQLKRGLSFAVLSPNLVCNVSEWGKTVLSIDDNHSTEQGWRSNYFLS